MRRVTRRQALGAGGLALLVRARPVAAQKDDQTDVVVYGGTAGGVMAAVQAARLGRSVVLIEPGRHLGGMVTGGLGATDYGKAPVVGGLTLELYRRLYHHYLSPVAWKYETREEHLPKHWLNVSEDRKAHWFHEPGPAEAILRGMVREAGVQVVFGERLDRKAGVTKQGPRITSLRTESGRRFAGRMFIDATYEGDLMATAGVRYVVGREANRQYDETLNGIRAESPGPVAGVDPFVRPGDRASGPLPFVEPKPPGEPGDGDERTQAYCFRICLTDVPENRIPFEKPAGYEPLWYELLARYLAANPDLRPGKALLKLTPMPNRKTDSNNLGPFSTDFVGASHAWAEASYRERAAIRKQHETYTRGLLWFLAHDPRVPEPVRVEMQRWGLPKDEFTDTESWPHQLYVREARRVVGEHVMTEHECRGLRPVPDPVGMGAYMIDSHQVCRFVDEAGRLQLEGGMGTPVRPYPISYRSLLPRSGECENLLVPVCLSASHAAYGTIRMEPVFMTLGQSSATAASLALEEGVAVQQVAYPRLRERLLKDGQVLSLDGDGDDAPTPASKRR